MRRGDTDMRKYLTKKTLIDSLMISEVPFHLIHYSSTIQRIDDRPVSRLARIYKWTVTLAQLKRGFIIMRRHFNVIRCCVDRLIT